MKRYKKLFSEATAPEKKVAGHVLVNNTWKLYKKDDVVLQKGQEYDNLNIIEKNSDGSIGFEIIWSENDTKYKTIVYYDSKKEAEKEGWVF